MEKISELMDGELEARECSAHIRRISTDETLARRWDHYHLIRDVLRAEAGTRVDLVASVRARLAAEPTVLAPRRRLPEMAARIALPIAAAVAGVVVGGWLAVPSQQSEAVAHAPPAVIEPPVMRGSIEPAQANGQMAEYLVAHQEYSPMSAMQGAASYVRIPFKEADSAR